MKGRKIHIRGIIPENRKDNEKKGKKERKPPVVNYVAEAAMLDLTTYLPEEQNLAIPSLYLRQIRYQLDRSHQRTDEGSGSGGRRRMMEGKGGLWRRREGGGRKG